MNERRRNIKDWADDINVIVYDADGFDRSNPNLDKELFTKEEFDKGLMMCTIIPKDYRFKA